MRQPPEKKPPIFKVGDKVTVFGYPEVCTIDRITSMSEEWLIRTAYAAGYYTYHLSGFRNGNYDDDYVSENVLTLALIETLGGLADG